MTVFWVVVACLTAVALLFVIPPMFMGKGRKDEVERRAVNVSIYKNQLEELDVDLAAGDVTQEQYDKSRAEIERRLLEDAAAAEKSETTTGKGLAIGSSALVAILVPAIAITIYLNVGNINAINPAPQVAQQAESPHGGKGDMNAQIEMMVGNLAKKLKDNPNNGEGWVMLGRSYSVLGRYDEAVGAYKEAMRFYSEEPNLLADYADAIAMTSEESLNGRPMQLLKKALSIDPNNQKSLWLMGTALFESGDFVGAIDHWSHLLSILPPGSEDAQSMQANIDEARSYRKRQLAGEFGESPEPTMLGGTAKAASVATVAKVEGVVKISEELSAKAEPGDIMYVFAKAAKGPAMPLAILKTEAGKLPLEFSLDESMAMMPAMSLAKFSEVVVGARISKSGDAIPQSGDLQGLSQPIAVGSTGLEILIDTVVP